MILIFLLSIIWSFLDHNDNKFVYSLILSSSTINPNLNKTIIIKDPVDKISSLKRTDANNEKKVDYQDNEGVDEKDDDHVEIGEQEEGNEFLTFCSCLEFNRFSF